MLHQLKERVEELEVRSADQKVSLGDSITRLRRCARTLESGASSTTPSVIGGSGAAYVTYPALNARDYVTRNTLGASDYVSRADLPTPIIPPLCYPNDLTRGLLTSKGLS